MTRFGWRGRLVWTVALGLAGLVPLGAACAQTAPASFKSSPARAAAFAQLPNWRGFWALHQIGASGTPDPTAVKRDTGGAAPVFTDAWNQKMAAEKKHDPLTERVCTFGFPTLLESSPLQFEVVSVPEETAMIFNAREVRHIYTDGKGHSPEDVRLDTPWGDSFGHWDGETLVVETVASNGLFRYPDGKGGRDSTHLSDKAVYHERIRMIDPDTLQDEFTVEDPQALREPYRFTRQYHRLAKLDRVIEELDCEGPDSGTNDRNPIVNGKWTLAPPKK